MTDEKTLQQWGFSSWKDYTDQQRQEEYGFKEEDGLCWFCNNNGDVQEHRVFDVEFDTPVHLSCIRSALKADPNDAEAGLMRYLLDKNENDDLDKPKSPDNLGS